MQHLLSLKDYSKQQIEDILALAKDLKANPAKYADALKGKSVVTLFEKPSLRTRVTLDIGINRLGGHAVYLDSQNGAMGSRETVQDFAANLSRWCQAIVARVYDHQTLVEMAKYAQVPVINSLCNLYHPCQALADFMTIAEHHEDLSKVHLVYLGDGNNVTNSLLLAGAILGATVSSVCPRGRNVDAQILKEAEALAAISGGKVQVAESLDELTDIDVLYTDTWVSMGDVDTGVGVEVFQCAVAEAFAEWFGCALSSDVVVYGAEVLGGEWGAVVEGVLLDGELVVKAAVEARFDDVEVVAFHAVGGAGEEDVAVTLRADKQAGRMGLRLTDCGLVAVGE